MPTNPASGLALSELMTTEQLIPANNLSDLPNRDKAAQNLTDLPTTVTIAIAASATTDGMDITVTAKDANGATLAGIYEFTLYMSESASGLGLTADTYSGTLTAATGAILGTMTAKKCFLIQTHTTGVFVGTLVDSANPADQYVVVAKPLAAGRVISAVSGANWEGA